MLLDGEVVALDGGRPDVRARSPTGCTCTTAAGPSALAATEPVTLHGLRPAAPRRRRTSPAGRWRDRRATARAARPRRPALAGAADVRRRRGAAARRPREQGLEGIVSKRRASPYHPGRRAADWLKFPHRASDVVRRRRLAARDRQRLGRLGARAGRASRRRTGCATAAGSAAASPARRGRGCWRLLAPLRGRRSPFADAVPAVDALGTIWVRPRGGRRRQRAGTDRRRPAAAAGYRRGPHGPDPDDLLADGESRDVAEDGAERRGRRPHAEDQQPRQGDVPRDRRPPRARCSHYYAGSPPVLLPHLADRAVTRIRWPHGTAGPMLLREEPALGRAGLAALGDRPVQRVPRRAAATRSPTRSSTTWPT